MKEKLKMNSGITLVALVVTIVIMLILAGVSLNFILGDYGIFTKSKEGANKYSQQQVNEQNMLDDIDIDEIFGIVKPAKVEVGVITDKNGTIDGKAGTSSNPTVPSGYMPVNTDTAKWDVEGGPQYNNGLVISDAETNGNEWVWIPVDSNTLSGMYETASSPIAITGGISLSVVTGVSTRKYSKSGIINGITRDLPNSRDYREPDIIVGNDGTAYDAVEAYRATAGFTKTVNGITTAMTLSETAQTVVDEYNEMIASIEKYGGFYIGRYELSSAGVKKDQATLTESSWYTLYGKCKELAKNETVKTRMIWGCQWDVTCNWIANDGDKKDITDSRSWGNYPDATSPANTGNYESGVKKNTGSNEAWKANNIYDFAGNCDEWTQEAGSSVSRAFRGGDYGCNGSIYPAIYRVIGDFPTFSGFSNRRFSSHFDIATIVP